jgi:hypothetical protein
LLPVSFPSLLLLAWLLGHEVSAFSALHDQECPDVSFRTGYPFLSFVLPKELGHRLEQNMSLPFFSQKEPGLQPLLAKTIFCRQPSTYASSSLLHLELQSP